MGKYTADSTYKKYPSVYPPDSFQYKTIDPRWAKSYTFYILPRFEDEKNVVVQFWVIEDLADAVTKGLSKEFAEQLSSEKSYQINDSGEVISTYYPLSGNTFIEILLTNLPTVNPKNGYKLVTNFWNVEKQFTGLGTNSSLYDSEKGLKQYGLAYTGKTVDEYIDYQLQLVKRFYQKEVYKATQNVTGDSEKERMLGLPENTVDFSQDPNNPNKVPKNPTPPEENKPNVQQSNPTPEPEGDWTIGTQSLPYPSGNYNFNVEKKNFFIIPGFAEFRLATEEELKKLQAKEFQIIDEEYTETGYRGEEETIGIDPVTVLDMRQKKDKELEEQYKKQESGGGPIPDSGQGGNIEPLKGGGTMKGGLKVSYTKKTPSWGKVTKGLTDAQLLKAMVDYIEGGYFYPGHAYTKFSEKDRETYASSGETLWGIDRCAGQTENSEIGKKFWAAFDKISGHGNSTGNGAPLVPNKQTKKGELVTYAQATNTRNWDVKNYPPKPGALDYLKSPSPSTPGYDIMYNSFVELAVGNLKRFADIYFKGHPLRELIFSDTRMKFCWFRATWNGPGWFSKYSSNLKKVYDSGVKDIDSLIIADLNHRASYNVNLITHDVIKIAQLLGIDPSQSA